MGCYTNLCSHKCITMESLLGVMENGAEFAANYVYTGQITQLANEYASSVGLEPGLFRFLISLFVAVPLGIFIRHIPLVFLRHTLNTISGITLVQFVFEGQWYHALLTPFWGLCLAILVLPRSSQPKICMQGCFVRCFCLPHLTPWLAIFSRRDE